MKSDRVKGFPGLTVTYKKGASPTITLKDHSHEVVETLNIEKWTTESLEEFCRERLSADPTSVPDFTDEL